MEDQARPTADAETEYNGWRTRDTWLVNVWLGNEERAYREALRIVAEGSVEARLRRLAEATVKDRPFDLERVDWPAIVEAFSPEPTA